MPSQISFAPQFAATARSETAIRVRPEPRGRVIASRRPAKTAMTRYTTSPAGNDEDERAERIDANSGRNVASPHPGKGPGEPARRVRLAGEIHEGAETEGQSERVEEEVEPGVAEPGDQSGESRQESQPLLAIEDRPAEEPALSRRWQRGEGPGSAHSSRQDSGLRPSRQNARRPWSAARSPGRDRLPFHQDRRGRSI